MMAALSSSGVAVWEALWVLEADEEAAAEDDCCWEAEDEEAADWEGAGEEEAATEDEPEAEAATDDEEPEPPEIENWPE